MKIRPVGAELSHADRQTYGEASSHFFAIFANARKNCFCSLIIWSYLLMQEDIHFTSAPSWGMDCFWTPLRHYIELLKVKASQMYRTSSSTIQPTNHLTGCLDLFTFHVAAQKPVISELIVVLPFSERSSLRCIVQPDGGSWHPKCLMNNSTKNAAPIHSFLKSALPHYTLGTNHCTRWM